MTATTAAPTTPVVCRNCHQAMTPHRTIRGRCQTCALYLTRTGAERPKSLWERFRKFSPAERVELREGLRGRLAVARANDEAERAALLERLLGELR